MGKNWTVYIHRNKINGKVYIGITSMVPEKRWANGLGYKRDDKNGGHTYFYNAIKKYGWENFDHEIILQNILEPEAKLVEQKLIATYRNQLGIRRVYNMREGGEGGMHSPDTKAKMSQMWTAERKRKFSLNRSGENNPGWGKKLPKEVCEKMSKSRSGYKNAMYGKHHSAETIEKIKKNQTVLRGEKHPFWGKTFSAEYRKKISESHADVSGANNPRARKIICVNTGIVFDAMSIASEFYGVPRKSINDCCGGKTKTSGVNAETGERFKWMYLEDYEKQNNVSKKEP